LDHTLNIGISLVDFTPGSMGGVETYVRNLVSWLAINDNENIYTLICTDRNVGYFDTIMDRVNTLVFETNKNSPRRLMRSFIRKTLKIDMMQVGIDKLSLDLLHNPFTNVRSSRFTTPQIITFHDLQHHYYPEFFKAKDVSGRSKTYQRAVQESNCLIADSEHTQQTLFDNYNISKERVHVVHLGVGNEYKKIDDVKLLEQERILLGLTKPFLYYPAATWLHKNHANLLSAIKILITQHHFDGDLVLTGVATSAKDNLLAKIAELGLQDRVHILGYLPYEKLPIIYNLARMLIFPSLYEGFGMPILEAMASGCPVVCSNVTSLPEVAGDAAAYFDPASPDEIAASIHKLWNDDSALQVMRENGVERAKQFSWENTARKTLEVYRRVHA
jgi:glycosyltransferase involved in cell wall biosynthesis